MDLQYFRTIEEQCMRETFFGKFDDSVKSERIF